MADTKVETLPPMPEVLRAAQEAQDRLVRTMVVPEIIESEEDQIQVDRQYVAWNMTLVGIDGTCIEAGVPADEPGWTHTDLPQTVLGTASENLDLDGVVTQTSPERFQLRWVGTMP